MALCRTAHPAAAPVCGPYLAGGSSGGSVQAGEAGDERRQPADGGHLAKGCVYGD
jgi:hypothetical protein